MTNRKFTPATKVAEASRMRFLPAMFGTSYFLTGETSLFNSAYHYLPDYGGGMWEFYEAGAVRYAVPVARDRWRVCVPGNYFDGEMSADAAGIMLSLFALNAMAMFAHERHDDAATDFLSDAYHALRHHACDHPEHRLILKAID
ncbi:antirestriction protein [Paraburkholderia youngii]|uniref:antirestriction protein n=1 Tax=Paraburkholderia youngii TaxID=2782701 RepID=UPI003D1E582B